MKPHFVFFQIIIFIFSIQILWAFSGNIIKSRQKCIDCFHKIIKPDTVEVFFDLNHLFENSGFLDQSLAR